MKLRLIFLGKTRRGDLRAMIEEYATRIGRWCPIEVTELRDGAATDLRRLKLPATAMVALLDADGRSVTSEQFGRWIEGLRDSGTPELAFLCGAAGGFPEEVRALARMRISLSPLTFSHELARAMLAEQLYRAFALLAGHPYPK